MQESGEDYLEAIVVLQQKQTNVRPIDVATHLNVSKPSVSRAIKILKDLGYITHNPYGAISLTPEGKTRGEEILYRHTFLTKFLYEIIELDKETAEIDACRIEHVLSKQTMENLMRFYSTYKGLKNKK